MSKESPSIIGASFLDGHGDHPESHIHEKGPASIQGEADIVRRGSVEKMDSKE